MRARPGGTTPSSGRLEQIEADDAGHGADFRLDRIDLSMRSLSQSRETLTPPASVSISMRRVCGSRSPDCRQAGRSGVTCRVPGPTFRSCQERKAESVISSSDTSSHEPDPFGDRGEWKRHQPVTEAGIDICHRGVRRLCLREVLSAFGIAGRYPAPGRRDEHARGIADRSTAFSA